MGKVMGVIFVVEDDEDMDCGGCIDTNKMRPNQYRIRLSPKHGGLNATTLAHELGHAVGRILKLPSTVRDEANSTEAKSRLGSYEAIHLSRSMMQDRLAEERQAWDFARMMVPLDEKQVKADLHSYEVAVEKAPFETLPTPAMLRMMGMQVGMKCARCGGYHPVEAE